MARLTGAALRRFLAARARFETTDAVVNGWRFSARRSTARPRKPAPVIVLLAGLGLSGRYLLPVAAELAERFPVWVPDLPGYGRSEGPREALDLPELADAVVAWMDQTGLERAALVGNSMGCQIAVEVAARHPARASHVVLEGPTMDGHARTLPRHLVRISADALREPLSLGPLQVADWLETGPRRLVSTVRYAFAHRLEERLASVGCPALVVRGARDPIVSQRWASEVAAGLPRGTLRVVPGGTHAMTYSNARILAEIVEEFVTPELGDGVD